MLQKSGILANTHRMQSFSRNGIVLPNDVTLQVTKRRWAKARGQILAAADSMNE